MAQVADVVLVKDNKVLLVQQIKESAKDLWSYPGGRVEEGETLEQAVVREVKEELGVELYNSTLFRTYRITTPIGQLEINTFTGSIEDQEIILKEDELSAYAWYSLDQLMGMSNQLRSDIVMNQATDILSSYSSKDNQ